LWEFYRNRLYRVLPAYLTVLALYFLVPDWSEDPALSPIWQFLTFTLNLLINYRVDQGFSPRLVPVRRRALLHLPAAHRG